MRTEKLFIYGTLRHNDIRKAMFGGFEPGVLDALEGFEKTVTTIEGVEYPNIVDAPGESVEGEVMTVNDEVLRNTDLYETDAYDRRKMTLASGTEAWVYVREEQPE